MSRQIEQRGKEFVQTFRLSVEGKVVPDLLMEISSKERRMNTGPKRARKQKDPCVSYEGMEGRKRCIVVGMMMVMS